MPLPLKTPVRAGKNSRPGYILIFILAFQTALPAQNGMDVFEGFSDRIRQKIIAQINPLPEEVKSRPAFYPDTAPSSYMNMDMLQGEATAAELIQVDMTDRLQSSYQEILLSHQVLSTVRYQWNDRNRVVQKIVVSPRFNNRTLKDTMVNQYLYDQDHLMAHIHKKLENGILAGNLERMIHDPESDTMRYQYEGNEVRGSNAIPHSGSAKFLKYERTGNSDLEYHMRAGGTITTTYSGRNWYDANGRLLEQLATNFWPGKTYRREYLYNETGQLHRWIERISESRDTTQWSEQTATTRTYFPSGLLKNVAVKDISKKKEKTQLQQLYYTFSYDEKGHLVAEVRGANDKQKIQETTRYVFDHKYNWIYREHRTSDAAGATPKVFIRRMDYSN